MRVTYEFEMDSEDDRYWWTVTGRRLPKPAYFVTGPGLQVSVEVKRELIDDEAEPVA